MHTEGKGIWRSKGGKPLKEHRTQCARAGTDQSSETRSCLVLDGERAEDTGRGLLCARA